MAEVSQFTIRLLVNKKTEPGKSKYVARVEFDHEGGTVLAGLATGNDRNALVSWAYDDGPRLIEEALVACQRPSVSYTPEELVKELEESQSEVKLRKVRYHRIHRNPGHRKGWGVSVKLKKELDDWLEHHNTVTELQLCDHNMKLVRTFLYTEKNREYLDPFGKPEEFYLIHENTPGG